MRIDTTGERGEVTLVDKRGCMHVRRTFSLDRQSPGVLLRAFDALRRKSSFVILDVVPGPGAFSRVRLGVVTANALAWALGVPLFARGRRVRTVKPVYGKPPSITLSTISERSERRVERR